MQQFLFPHSQSRQAFDLLFSVHLIFFKFCDKGGKVETSVSRGHNSSLSLIKEHRTCICVSKRPMGILQYFSFLVHLSLEVSYYDHPMSVVCLWSFIHTDLLCEHSRIQFSSNLHETLSQCFVLVTCWFCLYVDHVGGVGQQIKLIQKHPIITKQKSFLRLIIRPHFQPCILATCNDVTFRLICYMDHN